MRRTSIPTLHAERFAGQVDESTLFEWIRREQRVPAVFVGRREAQQILSLDPGEVDQATKCDCHPVVRLDINGETLWARISEVARTRSGRGTLHVEMTRLPKGEVVAVDVPVEIHHKSASRWAETPEQHLETVRIEGPVEMLPDVLEIDARGLKPDEPITVGDVKLPRHCEPIDLSLDTPIVSLGPVRLRVET
jgi:hypothetical protein